MGLSKRQREQTSIFKVTLSAPTPDQCTLRNKETFVEIVPTLDTADDKNKPPFLVIVSAPASQKSETSFSSERSLIVDELDAKIRREKLEARILLRKIKTEVPQLEVNFQESKDPLQESNLSNLTKKWFNVRNTVTNYRFDLNKEYAEQSVSEIEPISSESDNETVHLSNIKFKLMKDDASQSEKYTEEWESYKTMPCDPVPKKLEI